MTENQQLKEYRKRSTCTGHGFPTKYSQPLTERHSATCWCADGSHAVVFLIWSSFPWDLSDFEWLSTSTRESRESYVYFNMWSFKKKNKKKTKPGWRPTALSHTSRFHQNLKTSHLYVWLFLFCIHMKLMSMSLSFFVNFVSHRQFGLFSFSLFFVSLLSVSIYISI